MSSLEGLRQQEDLGLLEPEGEFSPDLVVGEEEDPATGDVTIRIENPLPSDMTPLQAYDAFRAGRISQAKARDIVEGRVRKQPAETPYVKMPTQQPVSQNVPRETPPTAAAPAPGPAAEPVRLPGVAPIAQGRRRAKKMGRAFEAQSQAAQGVAAVQAQRAQARDDYLDSHFDELGRVDARNAAYEEERRKALNATRAEIEQAEEDAMYRIPPGERRHHQSVIESRFATEAQKNRSRLALANAQKVDPHEAFGTGVAGAASKVMAAVAMGLGGFAAGFRGGPNHAASIIQRAIDRSVSEQQAGFARNRKSLAAKRGGYADMFSRFKDERTAELATRNRMINDAKRYVEKIMTENGSAEMIARGQEMAAVLDQKKMANIAEIEDRAQAAAERRFAAQEQIRGARAQAAAAQAKATPAAPRIEGWEPTGLTDIDPKEVPKAKAVVAATNAGMAAVQRALEIRDGWHFVPLVNRAAEAEVLRSELVGVVKTLDKAGALGDEERIFYMDLIGNISSVNPLQSDRLRAVEAMMRRRAESEMRAYGYRPKSTHKAPSQGALDDQFGMRRDILED